MDGISELANEMDMINIYKCVGNLKATDIIDNLENIFHIFKKTAEFSSRQHSKHL